MQQGQYFRQSPTVPGAEQTLPHAGNVFPRFFMSYRENGSGELVARELVELLIPGDAKNAPVEVVTDRHKTLWPHAYEAFKRQEEFVGEGTPIEAWGAISPEVARVLRSMNVMTVEQLADVSDAAVGNLMGGRGLRDKARQFVAVNRDNAAANKLVAENTALREQKELLERQLAELGGRLEEVAARVPEPGAAPAVDASPEHGDLGARWRKWNLGRKAYQVIERRADGEIVIAETADKDEADAIVAGELSPAG